MNSLTTIEYREKKSHSNADIEYRWKVANLKFHHGSIWKNMKHFLGNNVFLWCLPVNANIGREEDDGTYTHQCEVERRKRIEKEEEAEEEEARAAGEGQRHHVGREEEGRHQQQQYHQQRPSSHQHQQQRGGEAEEGRRR